MSDQTNDTLRLNNRYRLLETIGSGGMAVVYKAQDILLERSVAIKLLRQDYSNNDSFRDQFRREARSAANLSHPNIVTVHDIGYDAGRLFIVMEYVAGHDLKALIRQTGKFSVQEGVHLIAQACAGIGFAHRSGIVHCDVKPHNMLVTADKRLKLTDFGIARALSTINPNEKREEVWGSPQYFSPEQASGNAPSPASDVYSLGVVLYELLTGQLPFTSTDQQELARAHRENRPVPPRRLNREIPEQLEQIIMKVLSKEPAQRYRSADQLGRLLAPFSGYNEVYVLPSNQQPAPFADPPARPSRQTAPTRQAPPQPSTPPLVTQTPVAQPSAQSTQPVLAQSAILRSSGFSELFSVDIILLGLTALLLAVGLIPFWAYVLFDLGLIWH